MRSDHEYIHYLHRSIHRSINQSGISKVAYVIKILPGPPDRNWMESGPGTSEKKDFTQRYYHHNAITTYTLG